MGCLGGFCPTRGSCAHFVEGQSRDDVRLCRPGEEQPMPISFPQRVGKEWFAVIPSRAPAEPEAIAA